MGFAYRCDKCHQLTESQIVLCPSCAPNIKEASQPVHNCQNDAITRVENKCNEILERLPHRNSGELGPG
jgi:hypothetical protein